MQNFYVLPRQFCFSIAKKCWRSAITPSIEYSGKVGSYLTNDIFFVNILANFVYIYSPGMCVFAAAFCDKNQLFSSFQHLL